MQILIIEDSADILANLYGFFEPMGYQLDSTGNGYAGLALAAARPFDAIVLDLMLPGLDGFELCRRLRRELRLSTPVIALTARDTLQDKVAAFECGADDYVVKPFAMVELEARIKALVRRARGAHVQSRLQLGSLRLDPETFEVSRAGVALALTPTEFRLLAALMRAAPRALGQEQLELEIWGDSPRSGGALRTHIHALRKALDRPFGVSMLRTVQGYGYRLVDPDAKQ